jgi:glycosyltransferase involved in cell wall biosynthesis
MPPFGPIAACGPHNPRADPLGTVITVVGQQWDTGSGAGQSVENTLTQLRALDGKPPAPTGPLTLEDLYRQHRMRLVRHDRNQGKGAAVRTGVATATGDYLVILDADLEYDPHDIPRLLAPVLDGRTTVVYGSRTFGSHTAFSFWYVMGNRAVTTAATVLYNCYLSDLETGYKLLPVQLFKDLRIRSDGFGMEAELTGKLLRRGLRPYEIQISYQARSRAEGKKITWRDGVEALWILVRERVRRTRPTP